MDSPFEYVILDCLKRHFSDTPSSFDASNDRGALSTDVLTAAQFCFLSAAQGDVKKAIY